MKELTYSEQRIKYYELECLKNYISNFNIFKDNSEELLNKILKYPEDDIKEAIKFIYDTKVNYYNLYSVPTKSHYLWNKFLNNDKFINYLQIQLKKEINYCERAEKEIIVLSTEDKIKEYAEYLRINLI